MASRPRLAEARHTAGLTQRALAARLGWPQPVIAKYERGDREPLVRAAIRLAEALDTTVEAIWAEENDGNEERARAVAAAGPVTTSEVPDAAPAE